MAREIQTLRDLFLHELRGAYYMEGVLVDELDEMASTVTNDRISRSFADHREETREHVRRLQDVFEALEVKPEERPVPVVDAIVDECRTTDEMVSDADLLNMSYLSAGMKTERIEITTYDSLLQMAKQLELDDNVTDPLKKNRDDEKDTLDSLESLSTGSELKSLWKRLVS